MAKPPPNRVGKYELAEVIGEGAMGTVYRAVDPALHRDVAIKLMKKSFSNDPHLRVGHCGQSKHAGSGCDKNGPEGRKRRLMHGNSRVLLN